MKTMEELLVLWKKGADVPIDENECIEEAWAGFPPGTNRYEVWEWFEAQNPEFILGEILYGGASK